VQYEYNYYSVPFRLAGNALWLKATATMVTLYREHEAVAAHVPLSGRGQRKTVQDHSPPAAQAWQLRDTQWCLEEAQRVGPACHALVHAMFSDTVLVHLRSVQGVLRLKHKQVWQCQARSSLLARQPLRHAQLQGRQGHPGEGAGPAHHAVGIRRPGRNLHGRRPVLPRYPNHSAVKDIHHASHSRTLSLAQTIAPVWHPGLP
jgi:hypothetical protein